MSRLPNMALSLALVLSAGGAVLVPAEAEPVADHSISGVPAITQVGEELSFAQAYAGADRTVVRHPGATYVKVHFAELRLAPGDYITVASPDGREVHTYRGNPALGQSRPDDSSFTRHGTRGFAAMSVEGDTAVVTLHESGRGASSYRVDRYWRGFTDAEVMAHNPALMSVCGTDARRDTVCYQSSHPTEYAKSAAVARLLIGGGGLCTAWRVGNTNRLLTNNHCVSTQSGVASSEVQFQYECATCGGNNPRPGTKVSGATMLKTSPGGSSRLDYTLFSVDDFAAIEQFGTLYLNTRAPVTGERIYIPGHGDGRPKRLSIYEDTQGGALCTVRSANADSYNMSYSCDTSGGNSGSPVLSADHKVIALHHLGGCPGNRGARMSLIYPEISGLIDNNDDQAPPGRRFENTTDVRITDLATVESPIAVSGVGGNAPAALSVSVDIKHTYRGDLVVSLVSPDGTSFLLEDFPDSDSADNVVRTYSVNASAETADGRWALRVRDQANQDVGYIDSWALQFP
ncbi:proprotein convertase P-domain-containing protein [Actinokineospora fastidiosa]|uniref:Serine protease n=1 Tax=Actinokineospora fastidiosa TaxID=1816 RepID=A0A918GF23_9PSEU|nr:proprotein convertase P-domain-containing protein [Actinokineospora fastidiosa]GGS29306.1 hypothetical protein GCM10010171_23220 [Actinokineospora fastidiosa]